MGNYKLKKPPKVEKNICPLFFPTNCQVFLDSCPWQQLSLFEDILNMEADILLDRLEKIGHQLLRQPNRFILQPDIHQRSATGSSTRAPVPGLVLRITKGSQARKFFR